MTSIYSGLFDARNEEAFDKWCEHPFALLNSLFIKLRQEDSYEEVCELVKSLSEFGLSQIDLIINLEKFRTASDILNNSDENVEQNAIDALNFVYFQL